MGHVTVRKSEEADAPASVFRITDFSDMQLRLAGSDGIDKSWRLEITLPEQYLKLKANNVDADEDRAELQSWQSAFRRHATHYNAKVEQELRTRAEAAAKEDQRKDSPSAAVAQKTRKWKQRAIDDSKRRQAV